MNRRDFQKLIYLRMVKMNLEQRCQKSLGEALAQEDQNQAALSMQAIDSHGFINRALKYLSCKSCQLI